MTEYIHLYQENEKLVKELAEAKVEARESYQKFVQDSAQEQHRRSEPEECHQIQNCDQGSEKKKQLIACSSCY